jgi:hypothetical protein
VLSRAGRALHTLTALDTLMNLERARALLGEGAVILDGEHGEHGSR